MKRLLTIEWNKIFYYKTARIFILLYFVLLMVIGVGLAFFKHPIGGIELNLRQLGIFNFPIIWQNLAYILAASKIFLGVIIIMNVTNEFSNRTLKQNLIDGMSKNEFLVSKVLTNLVLTIGSTIFLVVIALTLGLIFSQSNESITAGIEYVFVYFLKMTLFLSFCLFISILLKKSSFALLGFFVWLIIENVFWFVEAIIKGGPGHFLIARYLPLQSSSNLVSFPSIELKGFIMGGSAFNYTVIEWGYVVSSIIYTVIFLWLSHWLLKRRDL